MLALIFLSPGYVYPADTFFLRVPLSTKDQNFNGKFSSLCNDGIETKEATEALQTLWHDIRPAPLTSILSFVNSHPWYVEAYYHPDNPSAPAGCKSFSYMAAEDMIANGFDVRIRWSVLRDHFSILALGILEDGSVEEIIIDYTADQIGKGHITPLVDTRQNIRERFPDAYNLYWSKKSLVLKLEDTYMDDWWMEYILIADLVDLIHKDKYPGLPLGVNLGLDAALGQDNSVAVNSAL
ncbi:MAG: hypothetical protein ACYSSI_10700 [Planctomycetota bacterium]|jgi:hypothetical protein